MATETYKGRHLSIRPIRDSLGERTFDVRANGQPIAFVRQYGPDAEAKTLAAARRELDHIDERAAAGDWGWEPHYYAPGTYEVCEYGHPHGIGQACGHFYCVRERTEGEAS